MYIVHLPTFTSYKWPFQMSNIAILISVIGALRSFHNPVFVTTILCIIVIMHEAFEKVKGEWAVKVVDSETSW